MQNSPTIMYGINSYCKVQGREDEYGEAAASYNHAKQRVRGSERETYCVSVCESRLPSKVVVIVVFVFPMETLKV